MYIAFFALMVRTLTDVPNENSERQKVPGSAKH